MPDINTRAAQSGGNTQWYYFAVSNMQVRARPCAHEATTLSVRTECWFRLCALHECCV